MKEEVEAYKALLGFVARTVNEKLATAEEMEAMVDVTRALFDPDRCDRIAREADRVTYVRSLLFAPSKDKNAPQPATEEAST